MSASRKRKAAARRLGIALEQRYERLATCGNDADSVTVAAVDLGQCFNDNVEFIIWALKTFGGLTPPLPEQKPANENPPAPKLPDISALVNEPVKADCICPPMEPGIIGYKHMTSCPQFVPAG